MFSSKTLAERNNDPEPYVCSQHGDRYARESVEDISPIASCDTLDPRPEFQHGKLEANPILVEWRQWRGADWARPERYRAQAETFLRWADDRTASSEDPVPWGTAQRAHAARALTLWLAVFA